MSLIIKGIEGCPKFKPLDLIIFTIKHKYIGIILLQSFLKDKHITSNSNYIVLYYLWGSKIDYMYLKSLDDIFLMGMDVEIINVEGNPFYIKYDDTFIKYYSRKYSITKKIAKIVNREDKYKYCRDIKSFITCDKINYNLYDKFIYHLKKSKSHKPYNCIYMIYKTLKIIPENTDIDWNKVYASNLFRYQSHLIEKILLSSYLS